MAALGFTAFGIGILAGVAIGLWWAYRKIRKQTKNIPEEVLKQLEEEMKLKELEKLKKEVQDNGKESSKKESGRGSSGGESGGKPKGFVGRDGKNLGGEPKIDSTDINPPGTSPVGEQPDIPIQSSVDNEGDESVDTGVKGDTKKRNKRNRYKPIE